LAKDSALVSPEFTYNFTLSAIFDIIAIQEEHQDKHQDKHQVDVSGTQSAVLKAIGNKTLSRKEIFAAIKMNGDSRSFKRHIDPLLIAGLIELTVPDKPNSRLQKYRLTAKGKKYI
jgi:predicted transcriptional regulator